MTGPACEFEEISPQFHIFFWTSLVLLIVVMYVLGMMVDLGQNSDAPGESGALRRPKTE